MIEELVARALAARDIAHRQHWRTTSLAEHLALNTFYADVLEAIDTVVENYQGMFDKIGPFEVKTEPVSDIREYLREEADWIEAHADEISQGSGSIVNLVQELTTVYTKAVYMLGLK